MTDVRDEARTEVLEQPAKERADVTVSPSTASTPVSSGTRRSVLPPADERPGIRWRPLLMLLLLLSPTLVTGFYFGLIATGRYVSHAVFVVRTAAKPSGDTGLGAILRMAGLGRASDDTYSVQNFLTSREAVQKLQAQMPLAAMYGRDGDWLSRYPSVLYRATNEDLFSYYKRMTVVEYNETTGVTTLEVQAFRPDDALLISRTLLTMAEDLVNQLNTRIRVDAVSAAEQTVKLQENRLTDAQVAVTAFQNKETMINPVDNATGISQIVGKLQTDLAQLQARYADMKAGSPNNPTLAALSRQIVVTQQQIADEQARVTTQREGLADKLGEFQRLSLEREFASKALGLASAALDNARTEARRKQLYIERVVEPELSDQPTLPLRLWTTTTVFLINAFAIFLGWVLRSGVKEHMSSTR